MMQVGAQGKFGLALIVRIDLLFGAIFLYQTAFEELGFNAASMRLCR